MINTISQKHFGPVTELAEKMHSISKHFPIPFSPDVFISTLCRVTMRSNYCGFVYETKEHGVIGAVLGRVSRSDFSNMRIANDIGIFVHPDHRNSRAGLSLIKAYLDWAKRNAELIQFSANAGIDNERAIKVLAHFGFEPTGKTLTYKGK